MSSLVGFVASALLAAAPSSTAADAPTYSKHVAPILWKNCAGCHRPGEVGPFSLLTYEDAAKRADFLVEVTGDRRMPPWKAEPNFGNFHDSRTLSEADLATLKQWAAAGAPEGDKADLPAPPKFVDGWQNGEPDLVLEMPEEFEVPADGPDIYQCFVLPIPTTEHRTVAVAEFRPGNRSVVHHAIMFLDGNGAARAKDAASPDEQGYRSFGGPGILPTGGLGSWAPGSNPRKLPKGMGKFLRHGSDMVLQIHYHPNGKPQRDRSKVGIYFTKEPATTLVGGLALMNTKIAIPPGEKNYKVTAKSEPMAADVYLLGLGPHMHLLGRQMKITADTPKGETIPLIWIKDWDFNWQLGYGYSAPVKLPQGSVIHIEATYDNSEDNPHNPSSPPKLVTWGEETTDEMCICSFLLFTDTRADLLKIANMKAARWGAALAGGVEAKDLMEPETAGAVEAITRDEIVEEVLNRGFRIPQQFETQLGVFDTDSNKQLSRAEFDAIPGPIRDLIRAAVKEKVKEATEKKS
jgi:mono/diheme cytochrome c family protein